MEIPAAGTEGRTWWRDPRIWGLLAVMLVAFSVNVAMASATFFMFLAIPVVVAASFAGPRATVALGACAVVLATISVALVDDRFFAEPEGPLRFVVLVLIVLSSTWMALVRSRAESRRLAAEAELDRRARSDDLTGLPNRTEALERLTASLQRTRRARDRLHLLFLDLDDFKEINDGHGHLVGDSVLRTIAERLRRYLRQEDFAARVGGDEFLVVLHGATGDDAMEVAQRISATVAEPIDVRGVSVLPSVSIGLALAGLGDDVDTLLNRADSAMYRAKASGRNQVAAG